MPLSKKIAAMEEHRERARPDTDNKSARPRGAGQAAEISLLDLQVLLATQLLSSEASGASIVEALHKNERHIQWPARVYAALDRLERDGLVRKADGDQSAPRRRGRRRSTIKLTPSGSRMLRQSLRIIDLLRRNGEDAGPGQSTRCNAAILEPPRATERRPGLPDFRPSRSTVSPGRGCTRCADRPRRRRAFSRQRTTGR